MRSVPNERRHWIWRRPEGTALIRDHERRETVGGQEAHSRKQDGHGGDPPESACSTIAVSTANQEYRRRDGESGHYEMAIAELKRKEQRDG